MYKITVYFFLLLILNFNTSASNIDSLKIEAQKSFNNFKVDKINQIAKFYLKTNVDSAVYYSQYGLNLATSLKYDHGKITALNKLAFANYIKNRTESAIDYANKALGLSRNIEDNLGKAQASNILGLCKWRIGAYPEAVDYYLKALDFATLAKNNEEIAKSNNYLGLVYWKTGNYPKSINYFYASLELKEEFNDKYEEALTLNNLSNIHNEIGDYQQAIVFAQKAYSISKNIDNKYTLGRALGNLGMSYLKMNNTNKALEYLNKALKIKRESGEVRGLGYTLIDVGNIYIKMKDYEKATEYYHNAFEIMTKTNDAHGLSTVLNKLAQTSFKQNSFNNAISYLDKSNKYAERENLKENIKENFLLYSEIYEKQNRINLAYNSYKNYSELKDSLINENINSKIKELNINYATNAKEKENQLLKQSNLIQSLELEKQRQFNYVLLVGILFGALLVGVIILRYNYLRKNKKITEEKNLKIEKQKAELDQLNKNKDKFFSILAHDLKNPFQTMLGYSSLLSDDYNSLSEDEKKNIIDQMVNVSKSSYQLLDNLLSWANTQTRRIEYTPKEYTLEKITLETISPIKTQANKKNQKINIKINPAYKVFTDINIFSTILRNLTTNAVKFSNIGGQIFIDAKEEDKNIIISVEDNGTGIAEKELKELFKVHSLKYSNGTAAEKGTGLGLVICKEFVEIYKGKIWAESEYGKGSKFYFSVPKAKSRIIYSQPKLLKDNMQPTN